MIEFRPTILILLQVMTLLTQPLPQDWMKEIGFAFQDPSMIALKQFLRNELKAGHQIYPRTEQVFRAFALTPLDQVKVLIAGQDPYHNPGQAEGLAFSVPHGVALPPSLKNIFQELARSYHQEPLQVGSLEHWAKQGVLLLNSTLTVRQNSPASHSGQGWEFFTNLVIERLSLRSKNIVFMLWGKHAQSKKHLIDVNKHLILEAVHPSPLSAYRGFIGCNHFVLANEYLQHHQKDPIAWYPQRNTQN